MQHQRKEIVLRLDAATLRRLDALAKRVQQTRAGLLRLWILAQLERTDRAPSADVAR